LQEVGLEKLAGVADVADLGTEVTASTGTRAWNRRQPKAAAALALHHHPAS